jgi:hypothetical protein
MQQKIVTIIGASWANTNVTAKISFLNRLNTVEAITFLPLLLKLRGSIKLPHFEKNFLSYLTIFLKF